MIFFVELIEGFDVLKSEREAKLALLTFNPENKPAPMLLAQVILEVCEKLHLSRPVLTHYLRANERKLENWAQGLFTGSS